VAKKKPARPTRPQKSAEPTTKQLRQEYYARRAAEQALEELGLRLDEREPPKGDAHWWAATRDALDRLEIIHATWRFTGLAGYAPEPEDFDPDKGWPTADEVEAVFGSWDKMLDESGIDDAIFGAIVEKALAAHEKLGAREKELEVRAAKLEDEAKKIPELKRREEVARAKRDEADGARAEAEAARDALTRERDSARARVTELEAEVAELRAAAAAVADAPPAESELLEEMERTLADAAATQQARDELHERMERLRTEREQDRRTIAELTQLLARVDTQGSEGPDGAVEVEPEAAPATVLEAVERAAAEAQHQTFAPKAFETAAESPFRRPGLVLRTLRNLDDLAGRFAAGDMGKSLVQAAADHGITQYKHDIAETTRKRYEDDYSFFLSGPGSPKLWVGPHIGLGSGSGAQFIARIYLHVSDGSDPDVPRGIVVAVVGRHLPDTTT
jgi:predicted  nucleic acid-binding Zn-ribbon protein